MSEENKWYKEFYFSTKPGEHELREALSDPVDGEKNIQDVRRRLTEMKMLKSDRCHVSRDQVRFLERVLKDYPG